MYIKILIICQKCFTYVYLNQFRMIYLLLLMIIIVIIIIIVLLIIIIIKIIRIVI